MNTTVFALGLASVVALGCSSGASAPAPKAASNSAAAPAAPPQAQRISAMLVGTWKGKGTMTMEGKTTPLDLELSCTSTSASWAVTCHARGIAAGHLHEETHLWGYNAETSQVHLFCVTNDGEVHDHAGALTDNGVTVQYTGTMEGKPMVETLTLEASAGNTIHLRNDTKVSGASVFGLDLTFTR